MLTATDLACSRGERQLFEGLCFALEAGQWLHVKGENGAGKTTLLRTVVGLSPADRGEVRWRGADIRDRPGDYRRAFLYLGHPVCLKDELSPLENLQLALQLDGFAPGEEVVLQALERLGLQGREDLPSRVLSAGQRRRVLLARLLLRPAQLWILDEPFNALDAAATELLLSMVRGHLDAGVVAVLTSHQAMPLARSREVRL